MTVATEVPLAEQVNAVFLDCLYRDEEIEDGTVPEGALLVEGVHGKFGFHPGRIAGAKEKVRRFLNEMPPTFHKQTGGGWSFLNLCMDKHDRQWAEQKTVSELICLGIACGMAEYCLPREVWAGLPGGVPYVVFDTTGGN